MNEEEAREIIDNMSEQELNNFIFFALQEVEKENQKLKGELLQKDKIIDEIEDLCIRKGDDESEEYGGVIIWNFAHKIMDIIKKGK